MYESRLLTRLAKSTRLPPRWVTRATRSTGAGKWQSGSSRASLATSTRLTAGQTAQYGRKGWPNQRGGVPVPATLDWDLFIGPAAKRPYDPAYTPWNWRGFWDFGTGALGDMACHIMDPLYWALDLKYPVSVEASSTLSNLYSPPQAQKVTYKFPARPPKGKVEMPELTVYWYDGGLVPDRPEELKDGEMMGGMKRRYHLSGNKGENNDRMLRYESDAPAHIPDGRL